MNARAVTATFLKNLVKSFVTAGAAPLASSYTASSLRVIRKKHINRIAEDFLAQRAGEIPLMIEEITQELQKPTQNVRDILDLRQNEEDVRAFLQLVVDYWKVNTEE